MTNPELIHTKTEILFFVYNLYIEGLSIEDIYHRIHIFDEKLSYDFEEINDIIDYLNEIF